MRTFEGLLILGNLLAVFLSFRKRSKAVWLWTSAANILILILHGIFEGLRYQMAFSYLFVMLIMLMAAIKSVRETDRKTPGAVRVVVISMSFVFLGLTAFLAYALPVFTLPKPTGPYAVGIQYFHWIDEHRTDPFLDGTSQKRELMVKVYYPATQDASKPFAPYFHHSPELLQLLTSGYGLPPFLFDHLNLVKTNSKDDLLISDQELAFPVILFSHGAGTSMETQTSQSEDLASHGYIVVAIDHTYTSAGTVFPDRVVSAKKATTDFGPDPAARITQIMADDASFVIGRLDELNKGRIESMFQGRLDLERIGAIGHSVGGAVAYNLAINDRRVKAAVDLDGVVYVTPQGDPREVTPFLMLANDQYHIQAIQRRTPLMKRFEDMDELDQKITVEIYGSQQAYQEAYGRAQQNVIGLTNVLKAAGDLLTIEGSDHMKFIDIGLFIAVPQLRQRIGIGGKTDPARCLEITKAVTLAFLDEHLKGETANALASLVTKYPELKRVNLE